MTASPHKKACSISADIDAALHRELETDTRRTLYALPTTKATVDAAKILLESNPALIVVATSMQQEADASKAIAAFRNSMDDASQFGIIFSDQLLSAANAPIFVEQHGKYRYLSALEVIACSNYNFAIKAWTGNCFENAAASSPPHAVLSMMMRYMHGCELLGNEWLMLESQRANFLEARLVDAYRRLRMLESAIMHAFVNSHLPERHQSLIKRIHNKQKTLARAAIP